MTDMPQRDSHSQRAAHSDKATRRTGVQVVDEQGAQLALLDDVGRLAVALQGSQRFQSLRLYTLGAQKGKRFITCSKPQIQSSMAINLVSQKLNLAVGRM